MGTKELVQLVQQFLPSKNVQSFLKMIRHCEGTDNASGYTEQFTGKHFENFVDHPRQIISAKTGDGKILRSDAAGAYQIMSFTWDDLRKTYGTDVLPNFSPTSQDLACCFLLMKHGAFMNVVNGNFQTAVTKCATEWASLPGSPYGQPTHSFAEVQNVYTNNGGVIA